MSHRKTIDELNITSIHGNSQSDKKVIKEVESYKKKSLLCALIFLQVLSEIGKDDRDKAILLYKAFKYYFVVKDSYEVYEQEKNLKKINFYKTLCKTLLGEENTEIADIDTINDILFSFKVDKANLNHHKKLIGDLLHIIQEKNKKIYSLATENELLNKDIRFWVHGYDQLKVDKIIRVII